MSMEALVKVLMDEQSEWAKVRDELHVMCTTMLKFNTFRCCFDVMFLLFALSVHPALAEYLKGINCFHERLFIRLSCRTEIRHS